MFYSNNNNYMQDLYSYNQIPNSTYNPYMNNPMNTIPANADVMGFSNGMNMQNMNMGTNQNPNMFQGNPNMSGQNPNNLYPSIYRIINPVVNRVVAGSNVPYLTEDVLNNMVDTVYNIVEGQVDLEEQIEEASLNQAGNRAASTTTTTTTQNPANNSNARTITTTDTRSSSNSSITNTNTNTTLSNPNQTSTSRRHRRNDSLLRDLIKILILRQIFSRNWMAQMPFNYSNQFGNNTNFMQPGMF